MLLVWSGILCAGESEFVRIQKDEKQQPIALETSMIPFQSEDGEVSVTLIGAIHLGEKAYYEKLNEEFKKFDAVLYEIVAPEGSRPVSEEECSGWVGWSQRFSGQLLGLTHQIGAIDYSAKNMIHADMTPKEFDKAMKDRNESFLIWYARTLGYQTGVAPVGMDEEEIRFWLVLAFPGKRLGLKRLMAEQMTDMDASIVPVEGKEGSALLKDRNDKALKILRTQLDAGKKNIAIFYGAAHLPYFSQTLEKEFHFKKQKPVWLEAWNLVNFND